MTDWDCGCADPIVFGHQRWCIIGTESGRSILAARAASAQRRYNTRARQRSRIEGQQASVLIWDEAAGLVDYWPPPVILGTHWSQGFGEWMAADGVSVRLG